MKTYRTLRFITSLAALGACGSCSHDTRPLDVQIREALTDRLEQYEVKGASAAVILPDGAIHCVTAGVSHDTVAVRPDHLFAIGSITKNYVAALILQLAEEGVLSLDDPVHKWLPPIPQVDSTITIREMLSHTSGIFMFWENQRIWDDLIRYRDSVFTPDVVLTYLKEPHFARGKGFRYSNTNYLLLAMIATRATRSSLSVELRNRFWKPLGFTNTYLSLEDSIPRHQLAHVWGDNFEDNGSNRDITFLPRTSHESITYGSSGVFTTAEELAVWCTSLFNGKIFTPASLNRMLDFDPRTTASWCDGYGLGVQLFRKKVTNGERAYGHGGGNIGTSAYMAYLPEYGVSIVVMINFFHGTCPDRMLDDIVSIVVDHLHAGREHGTDEVRGG